MREPGQFDAATHHGAVVGECLPQHPFGFVLGECDEAVRHVVGQRQVDPPGRFPVDEHELSPERGRGIERGPYHPHRVPNLEGTRLHTNGFRVLHGFGRPVDDGHVDAPPA